MSASRSHTATRSHPLLRRICSAWASEIFPHPTIATLSDICFSLATALEVSFQTVGGRHLRGPAQQPLHLRIRIEAPLPVCVPCIPIEYWWQLSIGPRRILLP